jgi:microcin C transport system substrate-binding protein
MLQLRVSTTAIAFVLCAFTSFASAEEVWHTSTSLIGTSRYADNFPHYDHVNPDAPKGGRLNSSTFGTFDSFNPYIVRGTAAAGFAGFGGGLIYETLMEQSVDEPSTSHPLLSDGYTYPDDYGSATYRLNPKARWHDGTPVTADDVIWSFNMLKEISPLYGGYYENITKAESVGERQVLFTFNQTGNRELPHIIGDLVVLPKHWWEGSDDKGNKRDIREPSLEVPLGSAAYRVKSFEPGSEIVWERVPDYWGNDLPVKIGRENFGEQRFVYFRDPSAEWEAFKKGGIEDIRSERRSQYWAQGYDFPAFVDGKVVKQAFATSAPQAMQGFALNTRRPQFQDRRVRQALSYAYDFESQNRTLLYGLRKRNSSFFANGELASSGVPQGRELEILEAYRDQLPAQLFTEPFTLPVFDGAGAERQNFRQALALFKEAGWEVKGGKLVNASGEQFKLEYLGGSPTDEIIAGRFVENLKKLGIEAVLRIVDPNQELNRVRGFDFDTTTAVLAQSLSPGNEQRDFWSSASADITGSRNLAGIKDPIVDALVDKIIFATDRTELLALTHALDRILLWNYYYIPQYFLPEVWLAWWDKFGMPPTQPAYAGVDLDSWWIDPDKAARLDNGN